MAITAEVICDSVTKEGDRLTTMELEFPRFILAEFNTHRAFSRNSASSRAIPVAKIIQRVVDDPYVPQFWGANKSGMQAKTEEITNVTAARVNWLHARDEAVERVHNLQELGLHKQWANRLLEPFMWHKVIVTSHEWENFFSQRCSEFAQPEMAKLAYRMHDALADSKPRELLLGQWHLPYVQKDEYAEATSHHWLAQISAARCARVSYLNHNGVRDHANDEALFLKLTQGKHASPMEHPACVAGSVVRGDRNFGPAWLQFRQILEL